jgi:hypothetical protein
MADGFIVRKGGAVTEQALAPTITEVSVTDSSITFTIKNEDTETATIVYRLDDLTAEGESISLAGGATSSNITESGLDPDETYTVFATANVTGKVKSNVTEKEIETDPAPVYTAATGGTTEEYDDGGKRYKSHTFTSNGTFEVTTAGNGDRNQVDYLIIGGGGSGGGRIAGGGGAGEYVASFLTVTAQSYSITIGSGGTAPTTDVNGASGANSTAFSKTALGGGGGGTVSSNGLNGGSGGGGGESGNNSTTTSGGTSTSSDGVGFAGGTGIGIASNAVGGGGGGASEVGANATLSNGGKGGDGLANLLRTGSNETRAGGGGGGANSTATSAGAGGTGGGGTGGRLSAATNATANTGSAGGGAGNIDANATYIAGNGAGGILIARYEIAPSV